MKKIIIISIFIINTLFASDSYESKLYEKILPMVFQQKNINIFPDNEAKDFFKNSSKFNIVYNCDDADLLVGKSIENFPLDCKNKPIFATSYRLFSNENSFGAFYWRKGRPQIKFKLSVIEKFNLHLPQSFKKYAK